MRILVVDNGGQWTHREWRVLRYLDIDSEIIPNTTPLEDIEADGLVLSGGSPRIATEAASLGRTGEYLDRLAIPFLGICVGHQFMALHFGGEAGPSEVPEFGRTTLEILDHDALFRGLPERMVVWQSHNDEVKRLPEGFEVLATSETCRIQAMRHTSRPLFGVQFHPEVEHTEFGEDIFRNFVGICRR